MDARRVVIFGGSFDPPHRAHVELPRLVMTHVQAQAVAYVPSAVSPLKVPSVTPAEHRLAMLRLALNEQAWATVLTDELDRAAAAPPGAPSYTVDTLEALQQRWPDTQMRLLIGADQLRQFDRWRSYRRVIELAEPVVMVRPPHTPESLLASLPKAAGFDVEQWRPRLVPTPLIDVSSTWIRQCVRDGLSIEAFVAPAVARYIREHGLYRR
jgi:nicotinate-nucleotide adenylyltransferase